MLRDRFEAPIEPAMQEPIAYAWDREPIYEGEEVYLSPDNEYVLVEAIDEWVEYNFSRPFQINKDDLRE